jgi:hypothetical protein
VKEFKAHETALLPLSKGDERLSVSVQLTVTPYAFAFHNPNSNFKLNAQVKFAQLKEALMHAGVGELSEIRKVGSRRNVRGKNSGKSSYGGGFDTLTQSTRAGTMHT